MDTYQIRTMTIKDYEEVYTLWTTIHGFGMRSLDDSKEYSVFYREILPRV